ncbi:LysM peptidoglycan-binding domain-containing protein [Chromobacterium alticapitis]|uniref:LysM peptidoglycan-binding domain-containing protein n=1 Tax=Chromobacterium alticapitis TaxID=2073169 RepID=UPI001E3B6F24|nr:LysM peptidoglycan-binding domain-containing protein [Chromobacterium alticapitis]
MSLALLFASSAMAGENAQPSAAPVDEALAAGLDMMLQNSSLLRNGDDVWKRVREGFQLDMVNADVVKRQENLYASRPEYFKRTLDRSRKYLFHIMNEVERRGMPTEIALLPMVESAFVPTASSRVGAAGLWQFMPATGRQYGLEQTWWYDGRRDVMDATRAALDYLQTLYAQFGDWNLALAAYNWGEGNLARAIAKTAATGQTPTYENVRLPRETRDYVPKLLAVRNILEHPERFGMRLDKFPNKPYFVAVSTGKHMNVDIAAKLAGISVAEFKELNPAFNLPVFAYKTGRQMLLPASKADRFEANLGKWDKPLLTWEVYLPKSDTNAAALANEHGMSASQLLAANRISGGTLKAGQPVLVAMNDARADNAQPLESMDAPLPETPAAQTMLAKADAAPAAPLLIAQAANADSAARAAQPAMAAAQQSQAVAVLASLSGQDSYTVASGDTLFSIARRSNMSVDDLKSLNNLSGDLVQTGRQLRLKAAQPQADIQLADAGDASLPLGGGDSAADPALIKVSDSRSQPAARSTEYVVQRGDTLYSIARRFGVNHSDIQRLSGNHQSSRLQPGQRVKIVGL